jgi:hypothetical protein
MRLLVFIIIFLLLENAGDLVLAGEDDEGSCSALSGLWSIYLGVAPIDSEIEREGPTTKQIQRNVERQQDSK